MRIEDSQEKRAAEERFAFAVGLTISIFLAGEALASDAAHATAKVEHGAPHEAAHATGQPAGHGTAHQGSGDHGAAPHHGPSLLWPTLNFIIYVTLFIIALKKFINPALKARAVEIEQQLQKASRDIAAAEAELSEREARRRGIAQEQQLIRDRLMQEGERIAKEVLRNGEAAAAEARANVGKKAGRELAKATSEVRQLVIQGSSKRARELLRESLTRDDDRRLRQEAINSLFE